MSDNNVQSSPWKINHENTIPRSTRKCIGGWPRAQSPHTSNLLEKPLPSKLTCARARTFTSLFSHGSYRFAATFTGTRRSAPSASFFRLNHSLWHPKQSVIFRKSPIPSQRASAEKFWHQKVTLCAKQNRFKLAFPAFVLRQRVWQLAAEWRKGGWILDHFRGGLWMVCGSWVGSVKLGKVHASSRGEILSRQKEESVLDFATMVLLKFIIWCF